MNRWIIAVSVFACWSEAAAALACKPSPDRDSYHQYRIVDGKKCWYPGRAKLEKSALAWKSRDTQGRLVRLARPPASRP